MMTRPILARRSPAAADEPLVVRPLLTMAIGVVGGIAVGLTSVGAGSLVIALLLLAYPRLSARSLVGTDILQAIPLVGAASLGHLLFGDVRLSLTASLLVGAIPGAVVGAHLSSRAPERVVRPAMSAVLACSALALLGVPTPVMFVAALVVAVVVAVTTRRPALAPVTT